MNETDVTPPVPASPAVSHERAGAGRLVPRWLAALEVFLVSGVPTQISIGALLHVGFGMPMEAEDGSYALPFFATVSAIDTVLVAGLVHLFLTLGGERTSAVLVGSRPVRGEALRGLLLVPVVFVGVTALVLLLRAVAPWVHTVEQNPLEAFLTSPLAAAVFIVIVVVAGGIREELQRAFILHRFEQYLGGVRLGLVLFSVAFGAMHVNQGIDIALTIGALGLVWGLIFIRRRSAILPMVNHAGFNALQVVQALIVRSLGS